MATGDMPKPAGDNTKQQASEEFPNAVVIPSAIHNKKGQAGPMELVTAEIEEGVTTVYDHNMYVGLASGRMKGSPDGDIIDEAVRITKQLRAKKLDYAEALASTRGNNQIHADPAVAAVQPPAGAPGAAQPAASVPAELYIPNVRVTYEGSFGIIRTKYHSVELNDEFLVMIFDKRCQIVDMYAPPASGEILEVAVGEGVETKKYYATALGINLDLDPKTINRYIIVLGILPPDHELVLEHTSEDGPPIEGDLGPGMTQPDAAMPEGIGQSSL